MTTPLRITCHHLADIPAAQQIKRLATDEHYLVLQFPPQLKGINIDSLISQLSKQLPDHSVHYTAFRDHSSWIVIKKVIDKALIQENAELIVSALERYAAKARQLVPRLAQHIYLSIDQLTQPWKFRLRHKLLTGKLDAQWEYYYHGEQVQFKNRHTGQVVEVRLVNFGNHKALLDPYFFTNYIRTTPEEAHVAALLGGDYHNAERVIAVLFEEGVLG